MAPSPFRPAKGLNTSSVVLAELARLWHQATHHKADAGYQLTQKQLAKESDVPPATVNSWATGKSLPRNLDQLVRVGSVLAHWAGDRPPTGHDWDRLLRADQSGRTDTKAGRLIAELSDPFALEVHRPVSISGAANLPVLPPYVWRSHDEELAYVVRRAASGHSEIAVLVGGSSTGKTRACWEAVHQLPASWRLWHPFDPIRPEAALAGLNQVGPRTVIWLNEMQYYLVASGDVGERVAAGLRSLLGDPSRAPVLVLGTLWPEHWDALAQEGTSHPQARMLLAGIDIQVPPSFAGPALEDLRRAAASDPRLAAAADADDGRVTQYLAGVPELMARYRHAAPGARALIHAAMDARWLGHGLALPRAFLVAAAPFYISDSDWGAIADKDWVEEAFAYTAALCKGVLGPLTRLSPRPAVSQRTAFDWDSAAGGRTEIVTNGQDYLLADYLVQHGRDFRADQCPPAGFWVSAADHACPADQAILANAARACGLYRNAAQLAKNAASCGDARAAAFLIEILHRCDRADHRPAQWVADRVDVGNPSSAAFLLEAMEKADAHQEAIALADRAIIQLNSDRPDSISHLMEAIHTARAGHLIAPLAGIAAEHVSLNDFDGVAELLYTMRASGAIDEAFALAERVACHMRFDHTDDLVGLLEEVKLCGGDELFCELADRVADIPLDDAYELADMLGTLMAVDADEQVSRLLDRDPAGHATLDDPSSVATLLDALRLAGADEQIASLLDRDPASHASLDEPDEICTLLDAFRSADADEQARRLIDREPATRVALDSPSYVAGLLASLHKAGAGHQVTILARRAVTQIGLDGDIDELVGTARLLRTFREIGDHVHYEWLADHFVARETFDNPQQLAMRLYLLRQGGADRQFTALASNAAIQAALDRPEGVARLLRILHEADAIDQFLALAERAVDHVSLDDPWGVASLLQVLHEAAAEHLATALLTRHPASAVNVHNRHGITILLATLRKYGADEQIPPLIDRLPAEMFDITQHYTTQRFPFGSEPDGSPTEAWGWENLY